MKKVLLPIIASLLLICSCHRRPVYPPQFYVADSLASVQPDSAIALLEALKADSPQWDKATQMYHSLLTVKARDKAFITHTSDSLMLSVLNYYEHGGDKRLLPEAYYYMGSTYRDMNDAPCALEYYQKALDVMPDYRFSKVKTKVYAQMGELFTYQNLYDLAIEKYKLSYQMDVLFNDTVGMLYNLRDIAVAHWGRNDIDSALSYFDKAMFLSSEYQYLEYENLISSQLAAFHVQLGNYEHAKSLIMPSLVHFQPTNGISVLAIAGEVYYKIGMLDSASYYYNRLVEYDNMYAQRTANEYLSRIAEEKGETKEALVYLDNYRFWNDSVKEVESTEVVAKMNALYNYQKAEKIKDQLLIEKKDMLFLNIIIVFLSFFLLVSIVVIVFRARQKQVLLYNDVTNLKMLNDKVAKDHNDKIAKLQDHIDKLNEDLKKQKEVEIDLNNQNLSKGNYIEELQVRIDYLEKEKELADLQNKQRTLGNELIHNSLLVQHLHEKAASLRHKPMTSEEWVDLYRLINDNSESLLSNLKDLVPPYTNKYKICILTRLSFTNSEQAVLLSLTEAAISMSKKRLLNELKGRGLIINNLKEFIDSL